MNGLTPGSLVRCRERDWVLLPSDDADLYLLRPLTGSEAEICAINRTLSNLGFDRVKSASFPLPTPDDASDAVGTELLWQAARLTLREGAGPFRSLGRISVRPRPYQFVPLMMALKLDPIRLLIADDVGIGKTIEALVIARELLDRGEVRRLCVLCPPYLCDQWQKELWEKFQLESVIIRSGTVGQLERQLPTGDHSVFGYFPVSVVSIDYAKSDSHRPNFLTHCPELVIVDEAHGAASHTGQARGQQQRHELLKQVARVETRHLILLTATPHSGVEESFRSLLGLLDPEFGAFDLSRLAERQRDELARHFVQRRRADVKRWLGEETRFPERKAEEQHYELSKSYRELFEKVYEFSRELVTTGETLKGWKQRIRYWSALALLRCVMSSPAAALAALQRRREGLQPEDEADDESYATYIYEPTDEQTNDAQPAHILNEGESSFDDSERRRLRAFTQLAAKLCGNKNDSKLARCVELVRTLLREGHTPIVWCRYIATSDYVAEQLKLALAREAQDLRIISITGALADDERRALVEELEKSPRRVLVSTDCLSEGVNLQEGFTAVLHYDLPWNPNRLEQREGRVDRFGQNSPEVKAVLLYGRDNPIDGAVLDVLLRKAKQINHALGITVPIPIDSETVMEAVLKALFFRTPKPEAAQLTLFEDPLVTEVHRRWEDAAAREKESRTRFAQRAIKPEEVQRELEETDAVLGDPHAVERFVLNACQRFGVAAKQAKDGSWALSALDQLPELVRSRVPDNKGAWRISFTSPPPNEVTYLGRNHPFVATLAQYLFEESLTKAGDAKAARCGAIRTQLVTRRTVLLLLKTRFMVKQENQTPMLAEEVILCGFRGNPSDGIEWLEESDARDLIESAGANISANIPLAERRELLDEALAAWADSQGSLDDVISQRSSKLEGAHRRVRASLRLAKRGLTVEAHRPADLLGLVVLQPVPKGVAR